MKHSLLKRVLAGALAAGMFAMSGSMPRVQAEEPPSEASMDVQWEEIAGIINSFSDKASWTSPDQFGTVYSDHLPDSALLGNGNTGITSAGNASEKTYLISDSGFWSDNARTFGYSNGRSPQLVAGGGLTIRPMEGKHPYNLAYGIMMGTKFKK